MKKILSYIIVFALGIGITVSASYVFKASDIAYSNEATTAKNVESAIDELYDLSNKHIETGSYSFTFSRSDWVYYRVTFDNKFDEIPNVYYKYSAGASGGSVFITNITTDGFSIGMKSFYNTANSDTVKWVAYES